MSSGWVGRHAVRAAAQEFNSARSEHDVASSEVVLARDLVIHPATDPVGDEAEAEWDEEPIELVIDPALKELAEVDAAVIPGVGATANQRLTAVGARVKARLRVAWPRQVIAVVAGLLLCASFPPLNWWWAAVVAFGLLSWVLLNPATTPVGGLGYGFVFGLAFYVPLLPWISLLVGAIPWLALGVVSALFPSLFGLLAVVVRKVAGWPIWFALLWAAQEWLKSIFPFGGFPWGCVAFGQAEGPLLPLVQLGSVALLSTGIVLVGCSLTAIALEIEKWWRTGGQARARIGRRSGSAQAGAAESGVVVGAPPAVVLPGVCICVVLFGAAAVWPQVRHAGVGSSGELTIPVAAVQGNVPRLGFDFNAQRRAVLDNHVQETLRLTEDVRAGKAPQPQFVIWPENAADIDPLINADAAEQISAAVRAVGAPIMVGTVLDVPGQPPGNPEYTNTVIVWNPKTGPAERHDKAIVQPFGEYLPMPWLFRHLSAYAGRAGHIVPRKGSGVVRIAGVPVGVATCWEVIFDRATRNAVRNGAQLLAVPSNNATFNKTMSEQQLAFAKVRAVEHNRYVIVAGTTGISAVIGPDGGELARTGFFQPAYLDTQVRLEKKLTPATRWGPILQWVLVGAAGAIILVAIRHNGWFPRTIRRRSKTAHDFDGPMAESEDCEDETLPPGDSESGDRTPPDDGGFRTARYMPPANGGLHSPGPGRHRGAT